MLTFLDSSAKADYTLNQKNVQKSRRSHGSSTGNWNPNHQPEDMLDPYYRPSSPSSDYFSNNEGERSSTPSSMVSMMTTCDYGYAQDELVRMQGEQIAKEMVEEQTALMKKELDGARNELDEQKKQAEVYKHLYDELMDTQVRLFCCYISIKFIYHLKNLVFQQVAIASSLKFVIFVP